MTDETVSPTAWARLSTADSDLSQRLARASDSRPILRRAAVVLAHSGDSPIWIIGLLLTWWLGSALWQREAQLDLIGVGLTAGVVQIIKWRVKRPRPSGQWGQGYRRLDPHSFPSGHAARAMMLAVIALFTGPAWWAAALTLWAPLASLARVAMRVHYISDVVVGALCGIVCGLLIAFFAPF